ncbi:hypothetical protein ANOM_010444 [Aspergillus nomiae NRRL 13137]|uniref:Mitochondrial F1F0 ATP synthase subunit Atp18 n=1 Tax=Aspergillus nomiae NRRL (strain ATCC 15546 / NRRL 13137 / CBS 260.88 / M93) TaxID=1509407 RepID=A0A0L1IP62_ASPN3|nr:uncharacterized protein ANOM_010444 [Aspergillus nomiae NRRL 13137]KNG80998.1 hypothetical protein ANOM_010444 [Aspergillus nomiae NRRL 13137]
MGLCGYGKSGRESDLRAKLVVPAPPRRTVFRLHQLTSHLYPLKTFPCNTQLVAMSLLGKKFPTPIAKPLGPFFAAGVVILYGVNSFGNLLMNTEEFKNDPRNPNLKNSKH